MAAYERYFTLADHVGLRDDNGAIEPFVGLNVTVQRPAMVKGRPTLVPQKVRVDPLEAGSRSFQITDPFVGEQIDLHMVATGFAVEIPKPTKKALASERSNTQDAINQAGTTGKEE